MLVRILQSIGALIGDLLAVALFVVIGISQHGMQVDTTALLVVAFPFAVALVIGHVAAQTWRAPFRVWPQGVCIWVITVVGGMAVRTLYGLGTEPSFVAVTAIVLGVLMLGWRGAAHYLTRHKPIEVIHVLEPGPAATEGTEGSAVPAAADGSDGPEGSQEESEEDVQGAEDAVTGDDSDAPTDKEDPEGAPSADAEGGVDAVDSEGSTPARED
jgi:hypothetical protein